MALNSSYQRWLFCFQILQNDGWNNAALREVRRYTGNLNKADQSSVFCEGLNVKKGPQIGHT